MNDWVDNVYRSQDNTLIMKSENVCSDFSSHFISKMSEKAKVKSEGSVQKSSYAVPASKIFL